MSQTKAQLLDGKSATIQFTGGSASAPAVSFTGDTNTGLWSPTADTIAASTGGSERLRIDSSGRLGLGTSSPDNKLSVGIASADEGIELKATYNGSRVARFGLLNPGVDNTPYIGSVTGNDFGFITSGTRRMTLDSTGRLGIGSTTPATSLHLLGANTAARGQLSVAGNAADPRITLYRDNAFIGGINGDTTNGVAIAAETGYSITFNPGGTSEKGRFDASGRLLVGTSSARSNFFGVGATAAFQVEGSAGNAGQLISHVYGESAALGGPYFVLGKHRSGSVGGTTLVANNDQLGAVSFTGADGTNFLEGARIQAFVDSTPGTNDMPGRLVFSTTADGASSPTERMRIIENGNVRIGRSSTFLGERLVLGNTLNQRTASFLQDYNGNVPTLSLFHTFARVSQSAIQIEFLDFNGLAVGNITNNTASVAYNTTSDYRLKENVVPLAGAAVRVKQLKPKQFNFISDPDKTVDGFLAHEAQAVVPECVTGTKDEVDADGNPIYQGIDQSKLVPLLTAALQEALAKIETLEARLTAAGI